MPMTTTTKASSIIASCTSPRTRYRTPPATSSTNIGSRMTPQAMAHRLRRAVEGSSLNPSARNRSAASRSDRPETVLWSIPVPVTGGLVRHRDHEFAADVAGFAMRVRLGGLLERVHPLDPRAHRARLDPAGEDVEVRAARTDVEQPGPPASNDRSQDHPDDRPGAG